MRHILNKRKYSCSSEKDAKCYLAYIEWACGLQDQELVDVVLVEKGKEINGDDGFSKVFDAYVRLGELLEIDAVKKTFKLDKALQNTPIILQKGMGLRKALRLKELLEDAEAKVNLIHYKKEEMQK